MKELQANYEEFRDIVKKTGRLEIPPACTPFIGTKQRKFPQFQSVEEKYQRKREKVAQETKARISWRRPINENSKLLDLEKVEFLIETNTVCSSASGATSNTHSENFVGTIEYEEQEDKEHRNTGFNEKDKKEAEGSEEEQITDEEQDTEEQSNEGKGDEEEVASLDLFSESQKNQTQTQTQRNKKSNRWFNIRSHSKFVEAHFCGRLGRLDGT